MLENAIRIQDKELENVYGTCGGTDSDTICCKKCKLVFKKSEARTVGQNKPFGISNYTVLAYYKECPCCKTLN